ncbi:MAG: AAA family ATPase [Verrucomicrobiota bacterium]
MILSPQQQSVLNELIPIARIATNGMRADMPIRPRTHALIVSPSGGGKSFLASCIGTRMGLPTMIIQVPSWVVLAAKNEPWTFSDVCEFVYKSPNGAVIVLDEVDKGSNGSSDWSATIFGELLALLDGVIPQATKLPIDMDDISSWEIPQPNPPVLVERRVLEKRLRERVFIVGCGAWQHAWRSNSRRIGFPMQKPSIEPPSREQLLQSMEPELRQRFRSQICWLPPMGRSDYQTVSDSIVKTIQNPETRRIWCGLADAAIDQALADGLGMRVFEDLMLTALLQTPKPREAVDIAPTPLNSI